MFTTSIFCMSLKYKNIVVSETNYNILKKHGVAGESFNDVITDILNKISRVSTGGESNAE